MNIEVFFYMSKIYITVKNKSDSMTQNDFLYAEGKAVAAMHPKELPVTVQ